MGGRRDRLDIAVDAPREAPRKSETEPRAGTTGAGWAPAARLENPVALLVRDTIPVVVDQERHDAVALGDRNRNARLAITARVLDHGLQDSLGKIVVEAEPDRSRRLFEVDPEATLLGQGGTRFDRLACDGGG